MNSHDRVKMSINSSHCGRSRHQSKSLFRLANYNPLIMFDGVFCYMTPKIIANSLSFSSLANADFINVSFVIFLKCAYSPY